MITHYDGNFTLENDTNYQTFKSLLLNAGKYIISVNAYGSINQSHNLKITTDENDTSDDYSVRDYGASGSHVIAITNTRIIELTTQQNVYIRMKQSATTTSRTFNYNVDVISFS